MSTNIEVLKELSQIEAALISFEQMLNQIESEDAVLIVLKAQCRAAQDSLKRLEDDLLS